MRFRGIHTKVKNPLTPKQTEKLIQETKAKCKELGIAWTPHQTKKKRHKHKKPITAACDPSSLRAITKPTSGLKSKDETGIRLAELTLLQAIA